MTDKERQEVKEEYAEKIYDSLHPIMKDDKEDTISAIIENLDAHIAKLLPTEEEIQKHIENTRSAITGEPLMDEQTFYEGAKWMRKQLTGE